MQADLVNKKLLDAKEVCERLWGSCEEKYYKRTIRIIKSGQIPSVGDGRKRYVKTVDLDQFLRTDSGDHARSDDDLDVWKGNYSRARF